MLEATTSDDGSIATGSGTGGSACVSVDDGDPCTADLRQSSVWPRKSTATGSPDLAVTDVPDNTVTILSSTCFP